VNEDSMRDEIFAAVTEVRDTPFDSLAAEVAALEKTHEVLQARLSSAGD